MTTRTSILLLILVPVLLLVGCASSPETPVAPAVTATLAPTFTPAPEGPATPEAPLIPTETAEPITGGGDTPVEPPDSRVPPRALPEIATGEFTFALPEPAVLEWVVMPDAAGLRQLEGFPSEQLEAALPSPSGRYWLLRLTYERIPMGDNRAALYVIDPSGESPTWVASLEGSAEYHRAQWSAEDELYWVEGTALLRARGDGGGYVAVEGPEPLREMWLAADRRVLVSGESSLWLYDLDGDQWRRIEGLDLKEGLSNAGAHLAIAPDGASAALTYRGQIYYVPFEPDQPARFLASVDFPGRGGRINAPRLLADSPYLLVGELGYGISEDGRPLELLVDTRDGTLVPLRDLMEVGAAPALPQLSPDGRWLALEVFEDAQQRTFLERLIVAPTSDLGAARSIESRRFLGWGPGRLYHLNGAGQLQHVSLPSFETVDYPFSTESAWIPFAAGASGVFIAPELVIDYFDATGHHRGQAPLLGSGNRLFAGPDRSVFIIHGSQGDAPPWFWQPVATP